MYTIIVVLHTKYSEELQAFKVIGFKIFKIFALLQGKIDKRIIFIHAYCILSYTGIYIYSTVSIYFNA